MTTASLRAYDEILPKSGSIKRSIYNYIKLAKLFEIYPSTEDVKDETGLKHQTATARLSELYDEGLIMPAHKDGRHTKWMIVPHDKVKAINESRRRERYKAWLKKGKEFQDLIERDREAKNSTLAHTNNQ